MIQSITLLLLLSSFLAAQPTAENDFFTKRGDKSGKVFDADYFPLRTDTYKIFDSNIGETIIETDSTEEGIFQYYYTSVMEYGQQFEFQPTGLHFSKTFFEALAFFGREVHYKKPPLRIPFPLQVGDEWLWEGTEEAGGEEYSLTIRGKALAAETVSTPAGNFACLKIEIAIEESDGTKNVLTEWLAEDIGVVKATGKLTGGDGIATMMTEVMGWDEVYFNLIRIEQK